MNTWKLVYKEPEYIHSGAEGFTTYQSECKAYRTGEGQSGAKLTVGDKVLLVFNNEVIAEGIIAHLNFWLNTVLGIQWSSRRSTVQSTCFDQRAIQWYRVSL